MTQGHSILLIDDDADIRDLLREMLQGEGYSVFTARHGEDALSILKAIPRPSLILLDMMMPVMDGWSFLDFKKVDPRIADIPVLAFSAMDKIDESPDFVGIIRKPAEIEDILELLAKHCVPTDPT